MGEELAHIHREAVAAVVSGATGGCLLRIHQPEKPICMPRLRCNAAHPRYCFCGEDMLDALAQIQECPARLLFRSQECLPDDRIAVAIYDWARPGDESTYDFYCIGPQQALEWLRQMSSKRWITAWHLGVFALLMLMTLPEFSSVGRFVVIVAWRAC